MRVSSTTFRRKRAAGVGGVYAFSGRNVKIVLACFPPLRKHRRQSARDTGCRSRRRGRRATAPASQSSVMARSHLAACGACSGFSRTSACRKHGRDALLAAACPRCGGAQVPEAHRSVCIFPHALAAWNPGAQMPCCPCSPVVPASIIHPPRRCARTRCCTTWARASAASLPSSGRTPTPAALWASKSTAAGRGRKAAYIVRTVE